MSSLVNGLDTDYKHLARATHSQTLKVREKLFDDSLNLLFPRVSGLPVLVKVIYDIRYILEFHIMNHTVQIC